MDELETLKAEVRRLLALMGQLDPFGEAQRHPEWPLQLRGDADATSEMCECLNRLQDLTGGATKASQ